MGTVTRAMEAVSAVKMRKSQERALSGRSYAASALTVLERLSGTADLARHPLMQQSVNIHVPTISIDRKTGQTNEEGTIQTKTYGSNQDGKSCYVVVTSDKGLAGSLNSGVIKAVERDIVAEGRKQSDVIIIAMGRKGGDYFANRGYDVREKLENVSDDISENDVLTVTKKILTWHDAKEIGVCKTVYQNFFSSFEQQPTVHQIIPITPEGMRKIVQGIRPARGKYAPSKTEHSEAPAAYTVEPDADSVLSVLLPKLINIAVFHALLENKASEHSARMVAMKSATDKAKEMAQAFTRKFNKVRQAVITREVSEITSGIEAMK